MTIFKTIAEARKNKEWIVEPIKEEILKGIWKKFGESMNKAIEKTTIWEQEFRRYFMGDFDLKPDGIDRTLKVHARFWFDTWYMHQEKKRYMHHKKKRIDKKWSKNPDYYITRSIKRDYMPIIQTAVA